MNIECNGKMYNYLSRNMGECTNKNKKVGNCHNYIDKAYTKDYYSGVNVVVATSKNAKSSIVFAKQGNESFVTKVHIGARACDMFMTAKG